MKELKAPSGAAVMPDGGVYDFMRQVEYDLDDRITKLYNQQTSPQATNDFNLQYSIQADIRFFKLIKILLAHYNTTFLNR